MHEELGIACPKCDCIRWRVHKTKCKAGHIMRIRICITCEYRLVTHEWPALGA